jgi:peptidoglycan hydrolase-like protein with peptidoglycan-binding domain
MLRSRLLSASQRLNDCQVRDSAHVTPGDAGDHVARIQQALIRIDRADIAESELSNTRYGDSTAAAVMAYKAARSIINRAYQTTPDNIVGKMTITSLDNEMAPLERGVSDEFFGAGLRPIRRQLA